MRTGVVRWVFAGGLVAASVWADAGPAAACSCVESTDQESYERASVVFVGEVIDDWSEPPPESGEYSSDLPRWFTFATTAVYKGDVFEEQSVRTVVDGAACGMELGGTAPYLVFAVGETDLARAGAGEYRGGLCDGTRAVGAAPIPDEFGAARQPRAGSSASTRPDVVATTAPATTTLSTTPAPIETAASPSAPTAAETQRSSRRWVIPVRALLVIAGVMAGVVAIVRRHRASR